MLFRCLAFSSFSLQQIRQSSKESTGSSDTDSSSDDESILAPSSGPPEPNDKVQQAKETEAGAEISALVNYVQPVHFNSFENSESESIFSCLIRFARKLAVHESKVSCCVKQNFLMISAKRKLFPQPSN
jgi:hypothetical protein